MSREDRAKRKASFVRRFLLEELENLRDVDLVDLVSLLEEEQRRRDPDAPQGLADQQPEQP